MNKFALIEPSKLDLSLSHLRQCPQRAITAMAESLKKRGQIRPVAATGDERRLILVDGFKRQKAAQLIGMDKLTMQLLPFSGTYTKALIYLLNRDHGFALIEECLLLQELVEKDGLSQTDAAIMLERHKSWVSRRLNLIHGLNEGIIEDLQVGLLPPGSGLSLARLPRGNQPDLSAAIQRDKLKVNEIKRLTDLWLKAETPDAKRFILEYSRQTLELSQMKPIEPLDARIPDYARDWHNIIRRLKANAEALKHKSQKGFPIMEPEETVILREILAETETICMDSLMSAFKLFDRED